jgi:hypothetical protein
LKFIKRSARPAPKLSLILLDWSVRESFHLLHYLARQEVPRDSFEVLVIEYYSRVSDAIRKFEGDVDTWLLLEMPEDCYYHKHLMYNAGIVLARGDVCVICDSDAMVKPGFLRAIAGQFERDPGVVLHLDQFRNNRRDFYPFNFPSFEQVAGAGCINNAGGRTAGVLDARDPIHSRNYGACMCARRSDLIRIGGADEHVDFVGHICGPYDMTFRLVNHGLRELWHDSEFMYHTWHPGQAGVDNYLGPHDGQHMSTTSLAALASGRVMPLLENPAIRALRADPAASVDALLDRVIRPEGPSEWRRERLESGSAVRRVDDADLHVGFHQGYSIRRRGSGYSARLPIVERGPFSAEEIAWLDAPTLEEVKRRIDAQGSFMAGAISLFTRAFAFAWLAAGHLARRAQRGLLAQGAAAPASRPSLGGLLRRLPYRFAQFSVQCRTLTDTLFDLVPNLRHIKRSAGMHGRVPAVRLLVDTRRAEIYVRVLRALGAIPGVELERVDDRGQFQSTLAGAAAGGTGLLVSRGLLFRFYPDAVPLAKRPNLVII